MTTQAEIDKWEAFLERVLPVEKLLLETFQQLYDDCSSEFARVEVPLPKLQLSLPPPKAIKYDT